MTPQAQTLPELLPDNPLQLVAEWLAQAWEDALQPNPNSMVLATVDADHQPTTRVVLCKELVADPGYVIFYTNYESRKGHDLAHNRRAAANFHWDHRRRQVRLEGQVQRLTAAENDAYFASRSWQSRLSAWASQQSQPIASRSALLARFAAAAQRLGINYAGPGTPQADALTVEIPRPPHWGGYRLYPSAVELWVEGEFRMHDRARWERTIELDRDPLRLDRWLASRLQP